MKILVVEDLEIPYLPEKHEVKIATDVKSAMEILAKGRFDFVVADLGLYFDQEKHKTNKCGDRIDFENKIMGIGGQEAYEISLHIENYQSPGGIIVAHWCKVKHIPYLIFTSDITHGYHGIQLGIQMNLFKPDGLVILQIAFYESGKKYSSEEQQRGAAITYGLHWATTRLAIGGKDEEAWRIIFEVIEKAVAKGEL